MSNFRLRDPDCVFIHIPKTGGTSIRMGVWEKRYDGPAFGVIPEEWAPLFKFTFVRHPLDRLVSAWRMFTEGPKNSDWRKLPRDARPLDIDAFFQIVTDETVIYDERRKTFEEKIRHHAIPQTHPFNCLKHADFVGRVETIDADFAQIAARVGMTATLPRMHYTTHGPWSDYLSGRLLADCVDYYGEDFDTLGYARP